MSAPASIYRPSTAYARVRLPVERLVEGLEHEGRELEAQALRNLLESHRQQRAALTDYHRRLCAGTARLVGAVSEAA